MSTDAEQKAPYPVVLFTFIFHLRYFCYIAVLDSLYMLSKALQVLPDIWWQILLCPKLVATLSCLLCPVLDAPDKGIRACS